MSYQRLKGFADLYGPLVDKFSAMESLAAKIFPRYGFQQLRTPIVEATALFQRSIGQNTDVVQKEMFTFPDRKGRSLTLRPEATAGVLRACIEEGMLKAGAVTRVFTIGSMFRYERPQKGRMREFHQINCECLGMDNPYVDAGLISMLVFFLNSLAIKNLSLKINSLGCMECRPVYLEKLKEWIASCDEKKFCVDCSTRKNINPLRLLDCKEPGCREMLNGAPHLLDFNCPRCRAHFDSVLKLLEARNIKCVIDHNLVRGLDYYQGVTFEVVSDMIGSQTAVAGGGRYNGLLKELGGPDLPGIGFACGMERLALLMSDPIPHNLDFFLLVPDEGNREAAWMLLQNLREAGFSGVMNYSDASFKSLMRQAAHSGARFCLILGADEVAEDKITVKNMDGSGQFSAPLNTIQKILAESHAKQEI